MFKWKWLNDSTTKFSNSSTFQLINNPTVWNYKTSTLRIFNTSLLKNPSYERCTLRGSNAYIF
jgi:hypothetical protein